MSIENNHKHQSHQNHKNHQLNQKVWRNWSGLQQSHPTQILKPQNMDELQSIVKNNAKIRVVGAGHSFTPLVSTDATLLSLDHFSGIETTDPTLSQAHI